MKLLLIRLLSVSRSLDMPFKRAVRLSGEFFYQDGIFHGKKAVVL
ncbi:hypothetical protein AD16_0331 [Escherichia coli 3-267-03_S4_C2]|nr:hypothetical protein AD16_0331 [Escherichia coli 3-267-03_S4_C2]KEL87412.1 hypothetical protein AC22_0064 [Escherichia coli 5-366-08_S3_C2]